jgi:diguanylate cyclase (GGDEF)-like protein
VLLAAGLAGFAVADRFMRTSARPALWIAGAWAALPVLLAASVLVTGGVDSPALVWFALPAVTLGFRFEERGMIAGTVFVIAMFLAAGVLPDPEAAWEQRQHLIAVAALIVSTVILSGALVESDRAHRRRSTLDPLTGLFNRNALEQRLGELNGQLCDPDEGRSCAFLLCDLDHFKRVNDQFGHATGDAVLQDVAYTMRAALRAGDSIYRVGGEEILVILPGASHADAVEIAERLLVAVRERRPVGVDISLSIGVAVAEPGRVDCQDLLSRADAALYAAKAEGRDRVFNDSATEVPVPA